MGTEESSISFVTILLIGIGVAVVLSLLTLAAYLFGERSPLERNALGRIEAARLPAEVLSAERQYRRQRWILVAILLVLIYGWLRQVAPVQIEQATSSFFEAVAIAVDQLRDGVSALMQELRRGNE